MPYFLIFIVLEIIFEII